jgi:hypothetical protein
VKHALAIFVLLGVFGLFACRQVFTWPYYYDEADYMYAASLGWGANYTDTPAQALKDYVRIGLRRGADATEREALSDESRAGDDVNFYRHWHGPLYFYWLLALAPFDLDERATRSWSYVFPVITLFVIYCGSLWVLPASEGFVAAMVGSAFYLWSYATTFTNEITPHALFVLCYVAALMLLMKWRTTGAARYWFGAVIATAFAFCTLEVAFVLLVVMLATGGWRRFAKSLPVFAGSVFLLWPAAVVKLAFIKAYLFMVYLALFRTAPWGNVGFAETWRLRFLHSPWEWLLLATAAVLYVRYCDRGTRGLLWPVLLYAGLMLAVLLRVTTDTPRYMLPFLPALHIAAGFTFASVLTKWRPMLRYTGAGAICLLLLWNTSSQIRSHPILPAPRLMAVLDSLRWRKLTDKKLLVPQDDLPMIHYYFHGTFVRGYMNDEERNARLARGRFDAVLLPGYPVNLELRAAR